MTIPDLIVVAVVTIIFVIAFLEFAEGEDK